MKKLGALVATGLLVACGNPSESTSDAASPVVIEHSGDDRRKAILWEVDAASPSRILYCEIPAEQPDETCPVSASLSMTLATYQARLGDGLDRLFPQYGDAVTAAKAKLDAASAALQSAENDLAQRVAVRQGEVGSSAKPLQEQVAQLSVSLSSLSSRYQYLLGEITRIQERLADPGLSANDHDVLSAKLAQMTSERDGDASQMSSLNVQIADLQNRIDTILNHDAALTQLQADVATATKRASDAQGQVTQATSDLSAAVGVHDGRIGDAVRMVADSKVHVADFGDDASRLLFDPFRAASAPFASGDDCTVTVYDYPQYGYAYFLVQPNPGFIFPATATVSSPSSSQTVEIFADEAVHYIYGTPTAAQAAWPNLGGVGTPTGTLTCKYQLFEEPTSQN